MTQDFSRFKNASGAWLLKPLFFETAMEKDRVLYTLKNEDHKVKNKIYPSVRRLYLEMGDETEYYFAQEYFGGFPHWRRLLSCTWFTDYLSLYREELALKNRADNLNLLRKKATSGDASSAKFLLEGKYLDKNEVGRPSKAKIKEQAEEMFKSSFDVNDDLERILSGPTGAVN